MYISLVNHTEYSLKEGTMKVSKLIKETKKHKMKSVGVTESGNMFSAMEFYKLAKEINKDNKEDYSYDDKDHEGKEHNEEVNKKCGRK